MLTISQLAAYAGVTVRAVRHYHQIGLLPEPERDALRLPAYDAAAVVRLIRIRTLADAGVPLARVRELLDADAEDVRRSGRARSTASCAPRSSGCRRSRKRIAQLAAGDRLALPPEVVDYLDRLRAHRGVGADGRRGRAGRLDPGGGALARPGPRVDARASSRSSTTRESSGCTGCCRSSSRATQATTALLEEAADIMAELLEQADARAGDPGRVAQDELPFDLLDALADEADPRAERMRDLMRERGWEAVGTGWSGWRSRPPDRTVSSVGSSPPRTRRARAGAGSRRPRRTSRSAPPTRPR